MQCRKVFSCQAHTRLRTRSQGPTEQRPANPVRDELIQPGLRSPPVQRESDRRDEMEPLMEAKPNLGGRGDLVTITELASQFAKLFMSSSIALHEWVGEQTVAGEPGDAEDALAFASVVRRHVHGRARKARCSWSTSPSSLSSSPPSHHRLRRDLLSC
jgi:hypothetical protein